MNTNDKINLLKECAQVLESHGKRALVEALNKFIKDLDDPAPSRPKTFVVRALLKSDDDDVSDHVEAADWLATLNDEMIAYMCQDTGANEDTDDLFWRLDGEIGDDAWGIHVAARLGRYLSAINESNTRDTMGFSVRLDEGDLHNWVQKNRPEAWALYEKENA